MILYLLIEIVQIDPAIHLFFQLLLQRLFFCHQFRQFCGIGRIFQNFRICGFYLFFQSGDVIVDRLEFPLFFEGEFQLFLSALPTFFRVGFTLVLFGETEAGSSFFRFLQFQIGSGNRSNRLQTGGSHRFLRTRRFVVPYDPENNGHEKRQ